MQLQEEHTDNKAHWHLFRYCEKKQLYIFILLFSKSCFIVAFAIIEHVTKIMCYKKLASRLWPMLFILTDFFSFTYTFLFCGKIKSCCDCCFPQQIRPQTTIQLYTLRDYSKVGIGFQYKLKTSHTTACNIHHVSFNTFSFNHYSFTQS